MTRPIKPPRGAFIATSVLFHPSMHSAVRDTLIQLLALAWASNSQYTPPLSYQQLVALTGKTKATLYGHIAALPDDHAALRLQPAGDGLFIVTFADWLAPVTSKKPPFEILELPDQEEEESISIPGELIPPPVDSYDQGLENSKNRKFAPQKAVRRRLSPALHRALHEAGVFPDLIEEVASSGFSEEDLRALLAWCRQDRPESPAALLVVRMRAGASPPRCFYQAPCRRCGQYGGHAPNCSGYYLNFFEEHPTEPS
jgi:hypothetical protein